eukprot:gene429-3767_t
MTIVTNKQVDIKDNNTAADNTAAEAVGVQDNNTAAEAVGVQDNNTAAEAVGAVVILMDGTFGKKHFKAEEKEGEEKEEEQKEEQVPEVISGYYQHQQ